MIYVLYSYGSILLNMFIHFFINSVVDSTWAVIQQWKKEAVFKKIPKEIYSHPINIAGPVYIPPPGCLL